MNTNENWRDEHDRKYQQWESDKAVISDHVPFFSKALITAFLCSNTVRSFNEDMYFFVTYRKCHSPPE